MKITYSAKVGNKNNPTALIIQSGEKGKVVTRVLPFHHTLG